VGKNTWAGVQLHALYGIGTMYFAPSGVLYLSLEANPVTEMIFGMVLIKLE
jgi:hypothetical protein